MLPLQLAIDTFSATNSTPLLSHISDGGYFWKQTISSGSAPGPVIEGNALSANNSNGSSGTGGEFVLNVSSGVQVSAKIDQVGAANIANFCPILDGVPATSAAFTGYIASVGRNTSVTNWDVYKSGTGWLTTSKAAANEVIAGDVNVIRLARQGNVLNLFCNGVNVQSVTDSSAQLSGTSAGLYIDPRTFTDGRSNATLADFVVYESSDDVGVLLIGASVSYGYLGSQAGTGARFGSCVGRGPTGLPIVVVNQSVNGTTTNDWLPATNTYFPTALAAAQAAGCRHVIIGGDLGCNDAKVANNVSAVTHTANIKAIIAGFNAAGIRCWVTQGSSIGLTGSINSGAAWNAGSNTLIAQYYASDLAMVDGAKVLSLDGGWYSFIAGNQQLTQDGAHLTDAGYQTYWNRIGAIFASTLNGTPPGGPVFINS